MNRGLRRETINVEDWCDMDFSSMTFTITSIEQEKRIDGVTKIWFVPNDGVDYGYNFCITTTGDINALGKELLRESMLEYYKRVKSGKDKNQIKVGDTI